MPCACGRGIRDAAKNIIKLYNNFHLASIDSKKEVRMFGLGLPEMMVVLVIALLFFGPNKLPSLGKSIGEAIRGFKKGLEEQPSEEKAKVEK